MRPCHVDDRPHVIEKNPMRNAADLIEGARQTEFDLHPVAAFGNQEELKSGKAEDQQKDVKLVFLHFHFTLYKKKASSRKVVVCSASHLGKPPARVFLKPFLRESTIKALAACGRRPRALPLEPASLSRKAGPKAHIKNPTIFREPKKGQESRGDPFDFCPETVTSVVRIH